MSSGSSVYLAETSTSPHALPLGDLLDSVPLAPPKATTAAPDGHPEILAWAARQVRNLDLDPVAHGILTQIARFATRDGYAWPSIDTLRRLAKRTSRTVRSAIDRLEGLEILQVVERGWQRHPNHYRLGWAWSEERNITNPPGHVSRSYESSGTRQKREILIHSGLYLLFSLSSAPRHRVTCPWGYKSSSYESPGTRNEDVLSPPSPYGSPGTRSEPMIQQATLHDQEIAQHRLRSEWLDEHWPWIQENSNWQDLGGAEKHYSKFPKEFQRLQERYEAAQAAPSEGPEEPVYQVVDQDEENQEEAQAAWGQVLEALREQVPGPTFATYLQGTEGHALDVAGGVLRVVCPSVLAAQEIERRLYGSVVKQAERAVGDPVEVYFVTRAAA